MDVEEFRRHGKEMIDLVADYIDTIRSRPVSSSVEPGYIWKLVPDQAPEEGEPWKNVMGDIEKVVMPGMTHWHNPRFHAFFPTANSFPGILGDILSSALACIGFSWAASPACTELEMVMMDWLAKMLGLPASFLFSSGGDGGGVIQGTASEATVVALLAARTKAIKRELEVHPDWTPAMVIDKLIAYTSEQSHSSVERAGMLGATKMRALATNEKLEMTGRVVEEAIKEDQAKGLIPYYVVATLGTTNTCAFDKLDEIGSVCEKFGVWLHVDAAYAGSAFVCPEYRHYLAGIEKADSFNMNPHKWLMINFDCSAMWVKNRYDLENAFNVNPEYLKHDAQKKITDYRHWQIPLGRRFRSLKIWFVLRSYGIKKIQDHIRKQISQSGLFSSLLEQDHRFEYFCPPAMGLVCFRIKGTNEDNQEYLKAILDRKNIFLSPSKVNGTYFLRFAVCSRLTTNEDIEISWKEFQTVATQYLKSVGKVTYNGNNL